MIGLFQIKTQPPHIEGVFLSQKISGGRTRLPKFKFLANFPIGLHVILQIRIKKIKSA